VLSNKEKAARAGLVRQRTPPQCVMDDFLGEASLNAVLHWFLGGSTQWLSTTNAGEPMFQVLDIMVDVELGLRIAIRHLFSIIFQSPR